MLLGSSPRNAPRCFCDASSQPLLSPDKFRAYVICPRQLSRRLWAPNAAACAAQAVPSADQPPVLATQEHVEEWHGQKRRDEYNWLSRFGPTHPEVLSYLKAESQYTLSKLAHTRQLQLDLQDSLQAWSNARTATESHHEQQQQHQGAQTTASASYSAIPKHKFAVHPDWLAGHGLLQYKQCTSFRWPGIIVGQYRFFSVPASSSTTALMHCRVAADAVSDTAAEPYVSGTDADVITGGALPPGSVILWDESGSSSSSSGGGTAASSSSSVHSLAVSPCGKYVAVTYGYNNGRTYNLSVIDSSTGDALLQPVRDVDGPIVWVTQAAQPAAAAAAAAAAANTDATNPTTAQHAKELQHHQQQSQQYLLLVTDDYREVQCLTVSSSSSSTQTAAAAAAAATNHLPAAAPCSIFRDPQHVSLDISSIESYTFKTVFGADGLIRQVLYYSSSSSSHVHCTPNQAKAWRVLLPAAAVADCLQQEQAVTQHKLLNSSEAECIMDNIAAAAAAIRAAGDDDPTVRLAVTVIDNLLFVRRSCGVIPQGTMFVAQVPKQQQQQQQSRRQQQQELHWQMLLPAQEEFCLEAAFINNASFSSSDSGGGSSKHLQLLVLGWRHHTWQQQQQQQQQSSTDLHSGTIATCRRLELQLYDLHLQDCCHQQQQLVARMQQQYACEVPMPDAFYEFHDAVWYPAQQELHLDFSSLVRPRSRLTLNLLQQQWQQQKQETAAHSSDETPRTCSLAAAAAGGYKLELLQAVPDSFDQSCYDTLQIGVPALRNSNNNDDDDDVMIPLSLAYKKQAVQLPNSILAHQQQQQQQGYDKLAPQTSNPSAAAAQCKVLLTCYGSYGICEHVHFNVELLQLLDGGWVVAVAHVRGGGWLGRSWAEAGRGLAKYNSVTDLLSVTKYIHQSGLCSPGSLIVQGSSAGGWLAAAAALLQPSLFAAAVLTVPCLDPLGLLLHEQQGELELGDAATNPQVYNSMISWAPYDLLEQMLYPESQQQQQQTALPHMLIRAALNDQEVPISNVIKTMARLRRLADTSGAQQQQQQQQQQLLLRVIPGGHVAYEGSVRESALKLAFMMSVVQ